MLCEGVFDLFALDYHLDANRAKYDLIATPGGFQKRWAELLRGRKVRGLFDNDKGGQAHGKSLQAILGESGVAAELQLLKWPPGFDGYDINDLVAKRPDIKVVGFVQQNAFRFVPEPILIFQFGRRRQDEDQKIDWIWLDHLRCGTYVSFSGIMGTLKSTIAQDVAARYTSGRPMPMQDEISMPPGHILYIYVEDGRSEVENGFEWSGGDFERWIGMPAIVKSGDPLNILEHLPEIEQTIRQYGVRLIIVDGQNSVVERRTSRPT